MDNRKRIRELVDEMIAIADSDERVDRKHLRIRARKDAITFLLRSEKQAVGKGDLDSLSEEAAEACESVDSRLRDTGRTHGW